MKKTAIILAGGEGLRAGGGMPKQFKKLCGRPVVWWSLKAFHDQDPQTELVLVLHPGYFDDWDLIWNDLPEVDRFPVRLCCGGRDRTSSVANGLLQVASIQGDLVAVHDGARPLVTPELIERCWQTAAAQGTAVPAVAVTDSLRRLEVDGASRAVDRSLFVAVQTPQTFDAKLLKDAYASRKPEGAYTDDASVVEAAGHKVALCQGQTDNMKITHPIDFTVALAIMLARSNPQME